MYGALILSVSGAVTKVLGACFRIPLTNLIGAEGMGYYQAVYPIYSLLLIVATAGIPVAISRLVSERMALGDYYGARKVFRSACSIMIPLGIILFAILFFGAEWITGNLKNMDRAVYGMMAIAPALIFVPIMATFRGFFQGTQNMKPSAVSQVVEQLFRVGVGLALAVIFIPKGMEYAAAGATFGATIGAVFSLIVIALIYFQYKKNTSYQRRLDVSRREFRGKEQSGARIIMLIFAIAIPITIGDAIIPLMANIDLVIVTDRLAASGWNPVEARSMYGQLTGMVLPLVGMPQVIIQAIAISLVPAIVTAWKTGDKPFLRYNAKLSLRSAILVGLPCSVGMMVLAEPIMRLLYPAKVEDAVSAAPSLFILAAGIVFLAMILTLTGILQGIGRQVVPVINLFIGMAVKAAITFVLTGIPSVNIKGAAFGTLCAYVVATLLDLQAVRRFAGVHFEWRLILIKPLVAALIMGASALGSYELLRLFSSNLVATAGAILLGGLVFVLMVFVTRAVTEAELALFPKGESLVKLYRKVLTLIRKDGRM